VNQLDPSAVGAPGINGYAVVRAGRAVKRVHTMIESSVASPVLNPVAWYGPLASSAAQRSLVLATEEADRKMDDKKMGSRCLVRFWN